MTPAIATAMNHDKEIVKLQTMRKRSAGQAVLWFLALIASISIVFVGVYSIGQLTSEKQKITNATDAAVYSGALVQARAMNMVAYGNRIQIANEVFIAQTLSLQSWTEYYLQAITNAKNVADVLSLIPVVDFVAIPLAEALELVKDAMSLFADVVNGGVTGVIAGEEGIFDLLDASATAVFFPGAMQLAANTAAKSVLAENYVNKSGSTDTAPVSIRDLELGGLNEIAWANAFDKYKKDKEIAGSSDGRKTAADILLASRDSFSSERKGPSGILGYVFGNESFGNCVTGSIGSSRTGTSDLKDYERWEMQDTSQFEYLMPGSCVKGKPISIPVGWGRATAANQATAGDQKTDPHLYPGLWAYDETKQHGSWSGIKALFDVERDTTNGRPLDKYFKDGESSLLFQFASMKSKANVRTNAAINILNKDSANGKLGNMNLKTQALIEGSDEQLMAISAAKVFFSRPQRDTLDFTGQGLQRAGDNHKEVASLYSPYWQVRLASPSLAAMALVYRGESAKIPFSQAR
jgi:hypothetical protein